jgi:hypothetical protein
MAIDRCPMNKMAQESALNMTEDLSADPATVRVRKRPMPVSVRWTVADGICSTLEGDVAYHAGDPILTGPEHEQWTMPRDRFDARYEAIAPTVGGADGLYRKKPAIVHALRLGGPRNVRIRGEGNVLHGEAGDWLLQYGADDYGIVAASIFDKTYDILAPHERK